MEKETASIERALREVDQITSLDTARMTLRWALEKLRALETDAALARARSLENTKEAADAARDRDAAREEKHKATEENTRLTALVRSLESRFAALLPNGQAGVALARHEAELMRKEDELRALRERLAREASEDKAVLLEESRLAKARLERETRLEAAKAHDEAEAGTAAAREDLSGRLVELHEGQARLRARERAHEEAVRVWTAERKAAEAAVEAQAAENASRLERLSHDLLERPLRAAQDEWQQERRLLLSELADWRARAREHLPALVEARNEAESLGVDNLRRAALEKSFEDIRGRLEAELAAANERHKREALARQASDRRTEESGLRAEKLAAELDDERRRAHAAQDSLTELEAGMAARLRDAEKDILHRRDQWAAREEEARRREREWILETEARDRAAKEHEDHIVVLRAALVDAIKTYRERSVKP